MVCVWYACIKLRAIAATYHLRNKLNMLFKTIVSLCLLSICNGERSHCVTDTRVSLIHHLSSAKVEISQSRKVTEDTWAEFSCTIKKHDTVKWRIGSFTDDGHTYNLGDQLKRIEELQIEYIDTIISGNKQTEVIRILATMDLNGLPIECMSHSKGGKKEYSQFALLEVIPSLITEGTNETSIHCV